MRIRIQQMSSLKNLKYRSKLEKECHQLLGKKDWAYEPHKIAYTMRKNYVPDFVLEDKYYVEVKGFFRPGDTAKYKAVAEQLRFEGKEYIFLMPKPDSRVRKGGKITYRQWCAKNKIAIFSTKEVKELKEWTKTKT
jgi:hypothetical protein